MDYITFAREEAQRQGVDPALVLAAMGQESGYRQGAVSSKGASGLMQLMPGTAQEMGVNPADPYDNIRGGIKYLRQQLDAFGDPRIALAAYNAGPNAVKQYGGIPPYRETQNYVREVMGRTNDGDIFGGGAKPQAAPPDDSDIFGKPAAPPQARSDDSDIFADRAPTAPQAPKWSRGTADAPMPEQRAEVTGWDAARDVAKSGAKGLQHGVGLVAGAPSDLWSIVDKGWQYAASTALEKLGILSPEKAAQLRQPLPGEEYKYGSQAINAAIDSVSGEYKPKTTAGEYAKTVGEFVPGALLGAQTVRQMPALMGKYAALPGVVSETAGQATKGTDLEPWARAGGALLAMGGAALASRPNTTNALLGEALSGVTEPQLAAAERLMTDARAMESPITMAEAVQQVTNGGTTLGNIQRVVEGSQKGGQVLKSFYADRAAGNDAAVRSALDTVAPVNMAPTEVAPRVQRAANAELSDARKAINDAARPYYEAAERAIPPSQDALGLTLGARADLTPLVSDPQVQAAIKGARGHQILGTELAGLPDDAFRVLDAAKKYADAERGAAAVKGQNDVAAAWSGVADRIKSAASQVLPDAYPSYAEARRIGQQGREQVLGPLERSQTGQLAAAETYPEQARILFSPNPLPNSEQQIRKAVQQVAMREPQAARDLVRMHLEQVFNETTQRLVAGENQWGGAKYAAVIAGNPQQAKNLEAAMRALPNGDQTYNTFRRVLDVLEAQGTRQAIGSQTEFNRLLAQDLGQGGKGEIGALIASPAKAASVVSGLYEQFRYGRNTEELAKLLTSPDAIQKLKPLALLPPTSHRAQTLLLQTFVNTNGATSLYGREPSGVLPPQ